MNISKFIIYTIVYFRRFGEAGSEIIA